MLGTGVEEEPEAAEIDHLNEEVPQHPTPM
jgi:hypothetical protein